MFHLYVLYLHILFLYFHFCNLAASTHLLYITVELNSKNKIRRITSQNYWLSLQLTY